MQHESQKRKQHAKTGTNPLYIEFDWLRLSRASVRGHHANNAKDFSWCCGSGRGPRSGRKDGVCGSARWSEASGERRSGCGRESFVLGGGVDALRQRFEVRRRTVQGPAGVFKGQRSGWRRGAGDDRRISLLLPRGAEESCGYGVESPERAELVRVLRLWVFPRDLRVFAARGSQWSRRLGEISTV